MRKFKPGDLIIVNYPGMEWEWARYKNGDLGILIKITHYQEYSVVLMFSFRTQLKETVPIAYIRKLGEDNGDR